MSKGIFISFEGPDGSGKSTQIDLIKRHMEEKGFKVLLTREPGGTPIGEKIRDIILDPENKEMSYMTEAMLYAASRAQHVEQVIRPALESGAVVICDRFVDSSLAYQGYGRNLGDDVWDLNKLAIKDCLPDVTFLFKIDPKVGIERIHRAQDRLELEKQEFHQAVFNGYLEIEKKYSDRVVGIDASRSIEEIHSDIAATIDRLLERR